MADDHTSQAWGIYEGILKDYAKSDNIKKLASEGMVLRNAFCTNSLCSPSRASILTGQYSNLNGVYTLTNSINALKPTHDNVAKNLRQSGYQTAILGKWHLTDQPAGFDYYKLLHGQGRYWDPAFVETGQPWTQRWEQPIRPGPDSKFCTDLISESSIEWLDKRDKEKPFFLMCHFKATHEPYDFPKRYDTLFNDVVFPEPPSIYDEGPQTTGRTFVGQVLENLGQRWVDNSPPNPNGNAYPGLPFSMQGLDFKQKRNKIYQKLVKDFLRSGAAVDDNIGKLLAYLKENDLEENTVVIYTADQGYFLGEHGFFDKRLIYEESLRMPFVIRYPKEIQEGGKLDDIVLNVDFSALFLDYAGVEKPDYIQGRSFRENLKGKTPRDWRTSMYYRYFVDNQDFRPAHLGLRNERYTLSFFYGLDNTPIWEFYDLQNDTTEIHNAYNESQYAEIIQAMKDTIMAKRVALRDTSLNGPYDAPLKEALKYWD